MDNNIKRWLLSTVITFVGVFIGIMSANWASITVDSLSDGTLVALIVLAFRTAVKASVEYFVFKK